MIAHLGLFSRVYFPRALHISNDPALFAHSPLPPSILACACFLSRGRPRSPPSGHSRLVRATLENATPTISTRSAVEQLGFFSSRRLSADSEEGGVKNEGIPTADERSRNLLGESLDAPSLLVGGTKMISMDTLHDNGMFAIQSLQNRFQHQHGLFFAVSNFGDPRYAFLIFAPLIYCLDWKVGRRLMWVTIIAEWSNQVLKWMLHGERPYWWVHETDVYNRTGHGAAPSIRQYSLTCETGPGSPSGHAMVSAAIWYIILDFAMRRTGCAQQMGKAWACSFQWCAYTALLCVVSLSRVYIAAHFPHQCLMGMVIGECGVPLSSRALQYG
ncbi:hypothetical protein HPB48_003093 [Haemaphysalis longicornis]|uniref:glucose-6-phosphatase n=1 Tax=Haemaphysalis longicornis TaxID=44386 RepID=A0A9J6G3C1_HAELO|nr:hypothetical protein HPB48_003093 [Haemaphysalis longicornis]